ncbi:MFS transporter [Roseibium sp.]|uniref:MFS transporter n=1 Tax=Roseibium sp. TaxID=1936156 RepID=UPI003BAF5A24
MSSQTHVSGRPIWLEAAAIALLLIATLKIMANATISPALPGLEASFADNPQAAYLTRFLVAAPSLSVVLIAPFAGFAADRFGRAPLLIAGVVLFAVSGSAGAYLPDLSSILASRLLLGVAVALTMTAQVALVGDLFDGERRSAFLGLQTAAINFSGFLFISLAGGLAGLSPRLPFLIYALPALLLPLLLVVLRQERRSRTAPNIAAASLPAASEKSWWLPSLGVAMLTMLTVMLFFLMPSQLPFYLEENGLDGALGTAFGLGALTLTAGCVAMAFKRISARLGLSMTFGLGFAMMATGFATLSLGASWDLILAGAAQVGAGYALVQPALFMLALHLAPESRRGRVSGMVTTAMFLGQVVSPLLLTPILQKLGFAFVYAGTASAFFLAAFFAVSANVMGKRLTRLVE